MEISVRDDGAGMAPEIKKSLFTPYATFDNANNSNPRGIGLGLVNV